jgi:hypothetical protein
VFTVLSRGVRRFGPVLVALGLLVLAASRFGVTYELAQFQLRDHPETWLLAHDRGRAVSFSKMRTDVIARGTLGGSPATLERFEERPTLLLTVGATTWLVASSNYAHLLLQNIDLLARPWLSPPWDARFFSIALGVLYLALVRLFVRESFGDRVAVLTTCLVTGNSFYLWEFGSAHTHVVGTLVLFVAGLFCLVRSVFGSRAWLAGAFVLLVLALSAKITAIGYLVAVGATQLWRSGPRAELRAHAAQWLTAAAAAVVAWAALILANVFFMDQAFYSSDSKLMINLARAVRAPWEIAIPVLHQLGLLVSAPVVYATAKAPLALLLLLVPVPIYVAGFVALFRERHTVLDRNVRACLLLNAILLGEAGIFYFHDVSFDLQLLALPVVTAVLVQALLSRWPNDKPWERLAALGIGAISGLGSVLAICAVPLYGFDLETERATLHALESLRPKAIVTIDPMSAYSLKWLEPRLPIVYVQAVHQELRFDPRRSSLPALRAFLKTRNVDTAVVPEHPLFEMPRNTPWAEVRAVFDEYFGPPRVVRDGAHDGVLVYQRTSQ